METPQTLHPVTFNMHGVYFRVVSFGPLSDETAENAVRLYCRTHKLKKKDKGKTITVVTSLRGDGSDPI